MTRPMITIAAAAILAAGLLPAPAVAQAGQTTLVIYGSDPCPREYICIRKGESDRYRLPKNEQLQGTRQQRESWANKSQVIQTVGDTGIGSCSAVGPGGHTGCLVQSIKQAHSETKQQAEDNQPPQ